MGTPITPGDPWQEPGCEYCRGPGELFEEGSPDQVRVKYTDVENCPLFENAPSGDYILPWGSPAAPCWFEAWDSVGRCHFVHAFVGGVLAQCNMFELEHGRFYFDNYNLDKTGHINNQTTCNLFGPPLHSGKNGYCEITPGYASDPLYFSYGLGLMPRSNLKYETFNIEGSSEKVIRFANRPDSINCKIRYVPANI